MMKKSSQKFESALDDFEKQRFDSCISNLYYSAFQAVVALLIIEGKSQSKHTFVRSYVNKELVMKGLVSKELGKAYNSLLDYRSDADYNFEITFEEEDVRYFVDSVKKFNQRIAEILSSRL